MNRRHFIKCSSAIGALCMLPISLWSQATTVYSKDILTGKGNPQLFGDGYRLQEKAHKAFKAMKSEALKENINIQVVSSYRNFDHQKRIWESKYARFTKQGLNSNQVISKIIEYSTIPGTSRHHWGTDLDIIDANSTYKGDVLVPSKFHGTGPFCKLKEWMDNNAANFGFKLVYTDNPAREGFKYEPWHYSFAEISKPMLSEYRKIDLKSFLKEEKLSGSSIITSKFIDDYISKNILDINPELL